MSNLPSAKYKLQLSDWLKGLLVAIGTTVIPTVISLLSTGFFPSRNQWGAIGVAGLSAGLTYILKNFLTDTNAVAVKNLEKVGNVEIIKKEAL